ncbi:MAG: GDSL-type esterase/lipase family protein [Pseudohongiellaceae bacterium]
MKNISRATKSTLALFLSWRPLWLLRQLRQLRLSQLLRLPLRLPLRLLPVVLPLLLLTTEVTAQANLDPTRWNDAMAAFAEKDKLNPPPQGAILLTGSSSIARWNDEAAAALAPLTVIPRGFGGSVMGDVLHHLDTVALQYRPRAILIYEGDNDTARGVPVATVLDQFRQIVDKIHETLPDTRIYVMAVKPSVSRVEVWPLAQQVNAGLSAIAERDPQVYFVDSATPFLQANGKVMTDIFVDDNLHLNTMGNLIWGSIIRASLMPIEVRYEHE